MPSFLPNASPQPPAATHTTAALASFITCAHQMLDPATPEAVRCDLEPRLLSTLPILRALGVFELFEVRHPGLRAWLDAEMAGIDIMN